MRWVEMSVMCASEGRENHVVKVNEMVPYT
jgi:hypothetical protein